MCTAITDPMRFTLSIYPDFLWRQSTRCLVFIQNSKDCSLSIWKQTSSKHLSHMKPAWCSVQLIAWVCSRLTVGEPLPALCWWLHDIIGITQFWYLWHKFGEQFLEVNGSGMKHVEPIVVCIGLDAVFELSLWQNILTKIFSPLKCLNFGYSNLKGGGADWDIWLNQICNGWDLRILWKSGPSWGNCNQGHKWEHPNILILKFKFVLEKFDFVFPLLRVTIFSLTFSNPLTHTLAFLCSTGNLY